MRGFPPAVAGWARGLRGARGPQRWLERWRTEGTLRPPSPPPRPARASREPLLDVLGPGPRPSRLGQPLLRPPFPPLPPHSTPLRLGRASRSSTQGSRATRGRGVAGWKGVPSSLLRKGISTGVTDVETGRAVVRSGLSRGAPRPGLELFNVVHKLRDSRVIVNSRDGKGLTRRKILVLLKGENFKYPLPILLRGYVPFETTFSFHNNLHTPKGSP